MAASTADGVTPAQRIAIPPGQALPCGCAVCSWAMLHGQMTLKFAGRACALHGELDLVRFEWRVWSARI